VESFMGRQHAQDRPPARGGIVLTPTGMPPPPNRRATPVPVTAGRAAASWPAVGSIVVEAAIPSSEPDLAATVAVQAAVIVELRAANAE
jgi:hypothetical protein